LALNILAHLGPLTFSFLRHFPWPKVQQGQLGQIICALSLTQPKKNMKPQEKLFRQQFRKLFTSAASCSTRRRRRMLAKMPNVDVDVDVAADADGNENAATCICPLRQRTS